MSDYQPKPIFFAWSDDNFRVDEHVEVMNQFEKWMYRALLQRMFFTTCRPFLPTDEATLMRYAGCDLNPEGSKIWQKHKVAVLARFVEFEVNGVKYLENPRVTREWDKLMLERARYSSLGERSADVKRTLNARLTDGGSVVGQEKVSEVKVSEGKLEGKAAKGVALASALAPGQLGYYDKTSTTTVSTKVITKRCAEAWQNVKGTKSAVCRALDLPNIKADWESMCANHPADLLIAAFELWASEIGFRDNTQWPLSKFFSKAQEYMGKVELLNGIGREVNQEAAALSQAATAVVKAEEESSITSAEDLFRVTTKEVTGDTHLADTETQKTAAMLKELAK